MRRCKARATRTASQATPECRQAGASLQAPLPAFVFEPEPGAQQRAGIVRHALQLRLVGDAAFALFGRFLVLLRLGLRLLPALLLAQGLLHALALRGIGLLLLARILRTRLRLLRLLRWRLLPVLLLLVAGIALPLLLLSVACPSVAAGTSPSPPSPSTVAKKPKGCTPVIRASMISPTFSDR